MIAETEADTHLGDRAAHNLHLGVRAHNSLMKRAYLFFILFMSAVCLTIGCSSQSPPKEDKDIELLKKLIVPNAYEVVVGHDNKLNLKSISYKVKSKYPSMEVLEFCDNKLETMGWQKKIESAPARGDRGWFQFIEGTMKEEPLVHQLAARWNNKEKSKLVILLLRYYSYNLTERGKLSADAPNTDILNVIIQVGPYVELPKPADGVCDKFMGKALSD